MNRVLFLLAFSIVFIASTDYHTPEYDECCGKCVGSANCNSCKNCSRCQHCNSGGSCGVCSSSISIPAERFKPVSPRPSSESGNTARKSELKSAKKPDPVIIAVRYAEVSAAELNVRSGPGTNYSITGRLTKGDRVIIIGDSNPQWLEIEYFDTAGVKYSGFVYRKFISEE